MTAAIAVFAAIAVGTLLRLAALWTDPAGEFLNDSAFHWRIINEVVDHGHVPQPDRFSDPPPGRDIGRFLPLGLYDGAGVFHAALKALGSRDLRFNVALFVALAGGLIAIPVYAASRALFPHRWPAVIAAAAAVFNPGHLHRTYAYWLRYDAPGTLLILAHTAFSLRALGATGRRAWIESSLAALFLILAAATWRVTLILPVIEIAFVLAWAMINGSTSSLRAWFSLQAGALLLAGVSISYLQALDFVTSPLALAALLLALALWIPWARAGRGSLLGRAALLAGAVGVAWGVSRVLAPAGVVGEQFGVIPARILSSLGIASNPSPWLSLQLIVDESRAASLGALVTPGFLSWSGAWFLAAPILFWLARGRPGVSTVARLREAPALYVFLALGLVALTLLFERNKVLLGPVAAIALGGLLAACLPDRRKKTSGTFLRLVLAGGLVISLAVTATHAALIAVSRVREPAVEYAAAINFLRTRTPAGTVVLCPWESGYDVQTYGDRAVTSDGLLEVPENRRHLTALARAAFQPTPDSLFALARETGARYILVPPSSQLYGLGLVAGVPFRQKLGSGEPLNPDEAQGVLVQIAVLGRSYPGLTKVLETGTYRVYRIGN